MLRVSPLNKRRWRNFKANRRGYISLWLFAILFITTSFAEFLANDKPLLIVHESEIYMPVFKAYPETDFGGDFATEADYRDAFVVDLIESKGGKIFWPPLRYSYNTINLNLTVPAPAPPSAENWLGTDDQGRDVLARLIYGFRISVVFGPLPRRLSGFLRGPFRAISGAGSILVCNALSKYGHLFPRFIC
jgi:microcin C transport system permease protein